MEKSLVIVKPDALQRGLVGDILRRFEMKGLKLVGIKMMQLSPEILNIHYAHLVSKPYFEEIRKFMLSTPVIVTCWEGLDCVSTIRYLCGVTKARQADIGTVRGDLGMSVQTNLVHASDTIDSATEEISRFFDKDELFEYSMVLWPFLYSGTEQKQDS